MPMLRATHSILSSSSLLVLMGVFVGNSALMNENPGKNRTNTTPSAERR